MPAPAVAAPCAGSGALDCPYSGAPTVIQHFGPGSVRLPYDVAVDGSGNTWAIDNGGNAVRKFDASNAPVALTTAIGNADRSPGTGNQQLSNPMGLGVDGSDNVYVADTSNNRVMEYGPTGGFLRKFGDGVQGNTGGHVSLPVDVAVDSLGNVFVAVTALGHNEIVEFDSAGAFVQRFGTFTNIAGLAVAGTHVYATEQGTSPGKVKVYTTAGASVTSFDLSDFNTPQHLAVTGLDAQVAVAAGDEVQLYDTAGTSQGTVSSVGGTGSKDGQFSFAFGLAGATGVAYDGANLAVTDQGNARIQKLTTAGAFVAKLAGPSDGELWRPGGAALGVDGKIVAADTGFNRLQLFTAGGSFSSKVGRNGGDGSDGKGAVAQFALPDDVAVDPNPGPDNSAVPGDTDTGNLYVADTANNQILRLTKDGTYIGTIDPGTLSNPHGVAVDATHLYVADTSHNRILVFDKSTGSVTSTYTTGAGGTAFSLPHGVDVTSTGDIWVADSGHSAIQVRDHSSGTWTSYDGGAGPAQLSFPTDVAVDEADGVVWVADNGNSRLQAQSLTSGAFVTRFGSNGTAPGQFVFPQHVTYDAGSAKLVVADAYNDRIQVFALGSVSAPPPTVTLTSPADGAYTAPSPDFAGTAGDGASDGQTIHIDLHARNPATGVQDPTDLGMDIARSATTFSRQLQRTLPDGFYVAKAIQNQGQPNQGVSSTVSFNVDTTAPAPTVTAPSDGGNSESVRPTISGAAGTAPGDSGTLTVEVKQGGQRKSLFTVTRSGSSWSGQVPDTLDQGGTFTVTVSQSDSAGHTGTSPQSTFTTYKAAVNRTPPSFSGAGTVGSTMTGTLGDWDYNGQIAYFERWGRCSDLTPEHCVEVGGGIYPDGLTYKVTQDDVGSRLVLEVVAANPAGQVISYSGFSGIVPDPNAPAGSNGVAAGSPKVTPPALGHTPTQSSNTCQGDLYFGPVGVHASCFKRVGLTWEATGTVAVNGLTLQPKGGAKVVIDPMNLRIAAKGTVAVVAGPATVAGARIGPFTLYEGSFDWVMQPNVKLPDAPGLATAIDGLGGGSLPSLGSLSGLPGLGSLASLPRLPDGLPDFSKVQVPNLKDLRIPTLDDARMQIPAFYLPVTALPAIGVDTGSGASLFGFPVEGKLAMRMVNDGVQFDVGLGLPQLGHLSAAAAFKVFNDGRFQLDDVKAHADEVNIGVVDMRPLDIHFNGALNLWEGTAGAYLPFPGSPGLTASAAVKDGLLKKVGLGFDGSVPLGPVSLSHIDFLYDSGPPTQFGSGVSLSAGPKVGSLPPAFQLDGKFIYQAGTPAAYAFTGNAKLVGHTLGSAGIEYHTDGYLHAFGDIGFHVGPNNLFGIEGHVDGWATRRAFEVDGSLKVTAPGNFSIEGRALVSSLGIAGCSRWNGIDTGAGYKWTGDISFFGSCGMSDFKPSKAARAAQSGARTIQVPAGRQALALAVTGSGAAPKVVLTGPGGVSIATPPDTLDAVRSDRFMLVQNPANSTTYVIVAKPAAGAWTIAAAPGTAAITGVEQSGPLASPHVRASISGHGYARRLTWKLDSIAGQKVRFVEHSGSVAKVLAVTSAPTGSIRFAPADGPGGARKVEAIVEQDGLVREVDKVTRYVAPKPRKLAAPRTVRVALRKATMRVRWASVRGAKRYRVYATVNGGRKVMLAPKGRAVTASLAGVFADQPIKVKVTAVDDLGRDGAVRRASRRAAKVRKAVIGLKRAKKP